MINTIVDIKDIHYTYTDPGHLLESIEKRGVAIAVQVNVLMETKDCLRVRY